MATCFNFISLITSRSITLFAFTHLVDIFTNTSPFKIVKIILPTLSNWTICSDYSMKK